MFLIGDIVDDIVGGFFTFLGDIVGDFLTFVGDFFTFLYVFFASIIASFALYSGFFSFPFLYIVFQ